MHRGNRFLESKHRQIRRPRTLPTSAPYDTFSSGISNGDKIRTRYNTTIDRDEITLLVKYVREKYSIHEGQMCR